MKLLMDWAVTITEAGFWGLLIWSWQAAVLIAGVWLGLKISRVESPALRHQVWLFGLIAVAVLPVWGIIVQVLPLPRPTSEGLINVVDFPRTIAGTSSQSLFQVTSPSPGSSSAGTPAFPLIIWSLLFIAWVAGALVVLFRVIRNTLHLYRIRLEAHPTTLEGIDCGDCRGIFSGIEGVSISSHDLINSPILVGILRPSILLPTDLIQWTTVAERRAMIHHEIAHLRRRDHYANLFQTLLNLIFYFHPLVIYACRQLNIEREMACDDRVIDQGMKAETYAEGLLKAAERCILPGAARQLGIISTKHILEKRVEMIMNKERARSFLNHRRHLVLSMALISVLVWVLAPIRSQSVGIGDSKITGRHAYSGPPSFEAALTAEQGELLKQASTRLTKLYIDTFLVTPNGTFPIRVESSAYGFVNNAFPLSPRLVIKTMEFEHPVTITLTEQQRQRFSQIMRRSITELHVEPTQDEEDMTSALPKSRYLRLIANFKNSIKPDAYLFTFVRKMEGGFEMRVMAEERNIHRWLGYYFPSLRRPDRSPRVMLEPGEGPSFFSSH
jgi:beta-lactamase regulating signal transducer with metallopeptidase domain